ncbi:MAG TPA: galactose-1-phosphate uridylyltransferase, partial [Microbacterium sp.]|nr:galactose-1-phosphate uridylyltransferase [Microbacterium sp.]
MHTGTETAPADGSTETLGAGVVKRSARLADGRELIYFDDPDTTLGPDRAVDARVLDPRPETATMR